MKVKNSTRTKKSNSQAYFTIPSKKELKIAMLERGITQKQLAVELGVSETLISSIVAGDNKSHRCTEHILSKLGFIRKRRRS